MADDDFQNDPRSQLAWNKVRCVHLAKQHLSTPDTAQRKRSLSLEKKVSKRRKDSRETQPIKSHSDSPTSKQTFLSRHASTGTLVDFEHESSSLGASEYAHNTVVSACGHAPELEEPREEPESDIPTEVLSGDDDVSTEVDLCLQLSDVKGVFYAAEQSKLDTDGFKLKPIDTYNECDQVMPNSCCPDAKYVDLCDDPHGEATSSSTGSTLTSITTKGSACIAGSSSSLASTNLHLKQQTSLLYFFKDRGSKFVKGHSGLQIKTSGKMPKGVDVSSKSARLTRSPCRKEKSSILVAPVCGEVSLGSQSVTTSFDVPATSIKQNIDTHSTTRNDVLVSSISGTEVSSWNSHTGKFSKPSSSLRTRAQVDDFSNQVKPSMSNSTMPSAVTKARMCPFYKKVAGTSFAVDAFSYGDIPACSDYFLSHFHSDHYMGLKRSFCHPIHCTRATGALVISQLKVAARFVFMYDLGTTHMINGVRVTFLDANHCPGAALILFQLPSGVNILHTGDFRACPAILTEPLLNGLTLHTVHLDTTYCDRQYELPTQDEVVRFVVDEVQKSVTAKPKTLVVCGSYTIGKEKVFVALAKALGCRAGVSRDKQRILNCLGDKELNSLITTNLSTTRLHVIPMHKLNIKGLRCYMSAYPSCTTVVGVRPTGWTYGGSRATANGWHKPQISGSVSIFNVPYSEHSSVKELESFVCQFQPKKVIPTVGVGNPSKRQYMTGLIDSWLAK